MSRSDTDTDTSYTARQQRHAVQSCSQTTHETPTLYRENLRTSGETPQLTGEQEAARARTAQQFKRELFIFMLQIKSSGLVIFEMEGMIFLSKYTRGRLPGGTRASKTNRQFGFQEETSPRRPRELLERSFSSKAGREDLGRLCKWGEPDAN